MAKKKVVTEAAEGQVEGQEAAPAVEAAPKVETFTLKSICDELGLVPATARRKLRAKFSKGEDFRWEFTAEGKAEVIAILTAKVEKAAKEAPAAAEGEAETSDEAEGETAEA